MPMDFSAPFTTLEFKQQFRNESEHNQIRWGERLVHAAFERDMSGQEKPVMTRKGEQKGYATSPCQDTLRAVFAEVRLSEGCELVIKPITLAELARNALYHGVSIALRNTDSGYYFTGEYENRQLGLLAAVQDQQGREIIYFARVFEFEEIASAPRIPRGSLQYWEPTSLEPREPSPIEYLSCIDTYENTLHIFDDQLDWTNPLFPELPDNAVALSSLSDSAQAFFNKLKAPLLSTPVDQALDALPVESSQPNSLIDTELLVNYQKFRARLNKLIIPPASKITLTVHEPEPQEDLSDSSPKDYAIDLSWTASSGLRAQFLRSWSSIVQLKATPELPSAPGTYPATEVLRERILDHLAWSLFQRGRRFDFFGFESDLEGLLPGIISNGRTYFKSDYQDSRFPCLARWSFGRHEAAVLLLGQEGRNFICKPMKYQGIPTSDRPSLVPYLDAITHDNYKLMVLDPTCDRLSVPASMIDFPEHWYLGARVSDKEILSSFDAALSAFVREITPSTWQPSIGTDQTEKGQNPLKWIITGSILALFAYFLFVGGR
ncbi:MAG: hypothetical protein CVV07_05315 [Gammaproteobacteria bacterium HGW-Gammaproteobacteria-11]|nr:MAG: hypothetical protein CVV07_05315 [Gammaproteobacteria bacterium HGW-Gammaproteobacteria-11]